MKLNIFLKIAGAFIVVSIAPTLIVSFLINLSYIELVNKYLPPQEVIREELFLNQQNIQIQVGLILLLIMVLTIFVAILISRSFSRPLRELMKGTKRVAGGDLNFKIKVESKDEIGGLATSFNKMVQDLRRSKVALEEAKIFLEVKVKARTKELEELTQSLEEKVKQRTKELRKRVNDLERFQKLTIGRELRMVELKKEIKKLKDQLSKKG